jgi:L-alanine-DL-glutamate epimerase-like enolase superfamily enzyme
LNIRFHRFALPLEHEFTIARGSTSVQNTLVVELSKDGVSGFGESTENVFYGHSLDSMTESIERCRSVLSAYEFGTPMELWDELCGVLSDDFFALAALDLAAHDLYGKLNKRRTHEVLEIPWNQIPLSSYTIGIADIETMIEKLRRRPDWSIYKIKLGTDRDVEIVKALREHTAATFRVDANCGWTAEETIENSHALSKLGVEFIEQPLPADADAKDHLRVFANSALPIVADESCQLESDVQQCFGRFHGVNVKLCKCGGLTPGARMLRQARSLGLKTMVGCMVESSVGISAAAQLLPLMDYADLDGAVLISEDPAVGAVVDNGVVRLSDTFGNGVHIQPTS